MARMIPPEIGAYNEASKEDLIYNSLRDKLSDEYIVLHSFKSNNVQNNELHEQESDFVIFHPKKGIMVIEAKHGSISYRNGNYYQRQFNEETNTREWKVIDPMRQASSGMHNIINKLIDKNIRGCRCCFAVWFHSLDRKSIENIRNWPSDASPALILSKDDLEDPNNKINEIFNIRPNRVSFDTNLTAQDEKKIVEEILCPFLNIPENISYWNEQSKRYDFIQLKKEQLSVLNFTEEQKTVAISGSAGTGKTVIAIEKARRLAEQGDKVLFLCYNKLLKEHLQKNYPNNNITYQTIEGLIYNLSNRNNTDNKYEIAIQELRKIYFEESNFPFDYNSIIIDEAQDLGALHLNDYYYGSTILEYLNNITEEIFEGPLYLFYDEYQLLNGASALPDFIRKAECKITLHTNCRNSTKIAMTATKPMIDAIERTLNLNQSELKRLNKRSKTIRGVNNENLKKPDIFFVNNKNERNVIDRIINNILSPDNSLLYKPEDIVILTCKSENAARTTYDDEISQGYYTYNDSQIKFSNCSKFKGMESNCIILIGVTEETLTKLQYTMSFYVGASRARDNLSIITQLNENQCESIVSDYYEEDLIESSWQKQLASILHCNYLEQ